MAVRNESVRLSLEDAGYTSGMARAAAATALLDKSLGNLDGSSLGGSRGIDRLSVSATKADRDINKLTGRLRLFRDLGITLGPALVPIGAVAIPAIAGLAAQFAAAGLAGGTMLVAFQGVGEALKTVNEAALDPTVENLQAAREAMEKLSPAAREFVSQMQDMRSTFDGLRDAAGEGLFPGLTSALIQFDEVAPRVEAVLTAIGEATGDIVDDFATGLTGSRGMEFLEFLRTEVPDALRVLGETMGNFTAGLAELWMAFTPLNNNFASWMLEASESFDQWASGLAETEGFENFVAYIRENGPKVAEALGAIGNALVNIVTAAAPLGGPVLQGIEAIADLLASIAGSDAGPPIMAAVLAMTLLSRSTQAFGAVSKSAWGQNLAGANGFVNSMAGARTAAIQGAAGVGLLAVSMTDLDEKAGLSNTAMGALVGTMIAPGVGTGIGALVGLFADLAGANDGLVSALAELDSAIVALDPTRIEAGLASVNEEYAAQTGFVAALSGSGIPGLGEAYSMFAGKGDEVTAAQRKANVALAAAEGRTTGLASVTHAAAEAARSYGVAAARQAEALKESRSAARGTAQAFVNLGDGVDDAKLSLAGWLRQLENQADALRNFRRNAEQAAERGLRQGLIAALHEAGPAGAMRLRQLANASEKEIARANQAWGEGQREIKRYTDAVGGVPTKATTKVNAETAAALNDILAVAARLAALDGDSATVTVNYQTTGRAVAPDGPFRPGLADGIVPGPRYPYRDSVPALYVPGEAVISNRYGQVDRNRELLAAINANRYADGSPNMVDSTYASTRDLDAQILTRNLDGLSASIVGATGGLKGLLKASEERLAEEREALASLKSMRRDLGSSVTEGLRGEIFGAETSVTGGDRPDDMAREDWLWLQETKASMAAADSPIDRLRQQIREARDTRQVLRDLARKGLGGAALAEVASTASLDEMRALLAEPSLVKQFERLYGTRQQATRATGQYAGSAVYDKRIDQQTAAVKESVGELRQIKQRLGKLEEMRQDANKNTDRTIGAIKGVSGDAARRHR